MQPASGFRSFLKGMQKPGFTGRRKWPIAFIPYRGFCLINPDDRYADRMSASPTKLDDLVPKIIDHPIDLLDHGFREYLHLDANLNGCDWSSSNLIAAIKDWCFAWDNFAKRSITAASDDAAASILNVQYAILASDNCFNKPGRPVNCDQIFIKVHRHEVALVGRSMFVDLTLKEAPELVEQPILALCGRLCQIRPWPQSPPPVEAHARCS